MLRNHIYILFLLLTQFALAQQVNVTNIVRQGNFNACSPNPNPTITAEIIDGDGSSVENGALVITDPCGFTTLRITMSNLRYYQPDANWPHGFFFPTGDNVSVANVTLPAGWISQTSCTGASCSAGDTGGVGFYYDGTAGQSCCSGGTVNDGNPSNNYGQSNMDCNTPFLIAFDMTFCNSKIETAITEFTLQGTSDGNTGCWSSPDLNINKVSFSINTVESDIILFDPAPINPDVITTCNNSVMNYLVELTGGCGNDNEITWWTAETGGTMIGSGSPFIYDAPGDACPEGTIVYAQCCPQGTDCDSRVPVIVGPCSPPSDTPTFNPIPPQCVGGTNPLPPTSIEGYTGTWSPAFDPNNTTTYTFTPTAGQCATQPTTLEVIIEEEIIPTFLPIDPICQNTVAPILPNSNEGVPGTWSPSVIDTTQPGIFEYTFIPSSSSCAQEVTIEITISEEIIPTFDFPLTYCMNTTTNPLPLISDNGITGTWNDTLIDTSTTGFFTYTFTPNDPDQCSNPIDLIVEIYEGLTLNDNLQIELCDENFDGTFEYDLTLLNGELITSTTGLTFSYYSSLANYNSDIQIPSSQWNNYPMTLPTTILVVAENADGCRSDYAEVDFIEGQAISLLTGPYEIPFCEGDGVNLNLFQNNFLTNEPDVNYKYYPSLNDAEDQISEITQITNFIPLGIGTSIYVRIEKDNGSLCPEIAEIEFIAGEEVSHNTGPFGPIEYCEEEIVDITTFTSGMAIESGVTLSYYETLTNAENGTNPIPDETVFEPSGSGIIYVRLEKTDRCTVILELPYAQLPSPEIMNLPSQLVLCEGQDTIEVEAESDDPNASYEWSWGNNQTYSGAVITITQTGTYTLTVIGSNGCRSTQELIVRPGGQPIITSIESGNDYLVVYAQATGGGMLEYSLNGVLWQASPRFEGLIKGQLYTVYVRQDGCLVTSYQAVILDVPNFLSPNGDGHNDQWTIRGIEVTPKATIKIFDRYGKIFVDTNFDGNYIWDGKYGGRPIPSGDYWYILEVPTDGVIVAQKFVGHLSIRN
ncbi:T9SS type B sorting domain-containing protein [Moheibacter sediminis]|uniref:Gliding motility-associated C-terminal domain-containing protein n=1 Tax=Moheibacter sediminis TaxID=1434700 RepID=A0A1W1Z4Q0_9FLAO|nr:T9SS type B sorting domain-containing protein [Moheibacter sediminis]SMC43344.1 gliding motility-associated C-terminal domain-containing protein [Moheibacter sediminis]